MTKQDAETVSAQGNATLVGAVYGLYLDGELVDQYVTDENGYFKTKEYVCGNYTVQEISPSEGYLLDNVLSHCHRKWVMLNEIILSFCTN